MDADTCGAAAGGGKLEIPKWCKINDLPSKEMTYSEAAGGGKPQVMKWSNTKWSQPNGYPWDGGISRRAAGGGHAKALKWCKGTGCSCNKTCLAAAIRGNLEIWKWCKANGCPWEGCRAGKLLVGGIWSIRVVQSYQLSVG